MCFTCFEKAFYKYSILHRTTSSTLQEYKLQIQCEVVHRSFSTSNAVPPCFIKSVWEKNQKWKYTKKVWLKRESFAVDFNVFIMIFFCWSCLLMFIYVCKKQLDLRPQDCLPQEMSTHQYHSKWVNTFILF